MVRESSASHYSLPTGDKLCYTMSYLKTLNELNVPIKLGDKYVEVKDRTNIVEAVDVCTLYHQGRRETCVIAKQEGSNEKVVYGLFDFLYSFAEYNEKDIDVVIDENYEIHTPESFHDNYNFD